MSKYRHQLPQMASRLFLTDGGLETTLIFHDGIDLPLFASFDLLKTAKGTAVIRDYYEHYIAIAKRNRTGFVLEGATWRASPDWGEKLGYSRAQLAAANRAAVDLMATLRNEHESAHTRAYRIRATLERHAPELVHCVLGGEKDAHARPQGNDNANAKRESTPPQLATSELRADDGKLRERGINNRPLEVMVSGQEKPKRRREDQQQREDREKAVVGDRGRQVGALVVGVFLQQREREAEPRVPLLEPVDGAVSLLEPAHMSSPKTR